jgi:DNA polymerase I-like protein with 3'-5' exonuclease and polymerase domains
LIEHDVETTGLQAFSGTSYAFMHIFGDDSGAVEYFFWAPDDRSSQPDIQRWLDRADDEGYDAWNSKFDLHFSEETCGLRLPRPEKWHDEMVRAHAIEQDRSLKLKDVGEQLFGSEAKDPQRAVKDWLTKEEARRKKASKADDTEMIHVNYGDVPRELIIPYGVEDVVLTRNIRRQHDPIIASNIALQETVEFERKVMAALYAAEKRGMPADELGYRALELEVLENLEALEDECIHIAVEDCGADEDFNPASPMQVYNALKKGGADLRFISGTSMDRENLEAVDHPLAYAVLQFRGEKKVLSTYVTPMLHEHYDSSLRAYKEPFIAPDGRIHTNFRQIGAQRTGRMSSSEPNMQNQPRDDLRLRYNICAEEGRKLVTCDLSGIEMALFAAYAGDGKMLQMLKSGGDPHGYTAKMVGIGDYTNANGHTEVARQRGKVFNFQMLYGGGQKTIKKKFRVDTPRARNMKNSYLDAYPEVQSLQARIETKLWRDGYVSTLWGRQLKMDPRRAYVGVNYLIQGTAAEILKDAIIKCHADGIPMVGFVHDEIIADCDEADAEEVRHIITKHMTSAATPGGKLWDTVKNEPVVPLKADGDIVQRWSEAKNPDFKPKFAREAV